MNWLDRDDRADTGHGGGFRSALRRIFGDGEDPLNWALPLYRAWGISVRIHLVFVVYIIATLIWSIRPNGMGPAYMAIAMGVLFVLVLAHEYGHCIVCWRVGGEADRILLWPLGGLAYCLPPDTWKANLWTTLGGPLVNAVLWPVLGVGVYLTAAGPLLFNPFAPAQAMTAPSYWHTALWWAYYVNILLLGLNILVPMYPLDGGRVLQALLWRTRGYREALAASATVGLVAGVILAVVALVGDVSLLLGIAAFGLIVCWLERRRVRMLEADAGFAGYDFSRGYAGLEMDERPDPRPGRREVRRREREAAERAEVDRILAKISCSGMDSLSRAERRVLARATKRK